MAKIRDILAAHALSGLMTGMFLAEEQGKTWGEVVDNAKHIALHVYDIADAALAMREVPRAGRPSNQGPTYMGGDNEEDLL